VRGAVWQMPVTRLRKKIRPTLLDAPDSCRGAKTLLSLSAVIHMKQLMGAAGQARS